VEECVRTLFYLLQCLYQCMWNVLYHNCIYIHLSWRWTHRFETCRKQQN